MEVHMDFYAIDVETADSNLASICQIGIVGYKKDVPVFEWMSFIKPDESFEFSPSNTYIHGITEDMVINSPKFADVYPFLKETLENKIVVHHTHFDVTSLSQACALYRLPLLTCAWLDSARIARRAWAQFSQSGYGVKNVCDMLGYQFAHHDALEDAKACAFIAAKACEQTKTKIGDWLTRVEWRLPKHEGEPSRKQTYSRVAQDGNQEGPLFGECVVFTGELSIGRREAAEMAAEAGCDIADSVTKKTTTLVVGDTDKRKLAGYEKTSKQRRAEEINAKGGKIKIVGETSFFSILKDAEDQKNNIKETLTTTHLNKNWLCWGDSPNIDIAFLYSFEKNETKFVGKKNQVISIADYCRLTCPAINFDESGYHKDIYPRLIAAAEAKAKEWTGKEYLPEQSFITAALRDETRTIQINITQNP
jgi:DNA polymerase-3 subunit epsilon